MSKLNEDLLAQVARGADNEEEMDVGAVAPPDYVSAVEDRKKIRKELPGRFKDQEKAIKAFVDDNHKREPKRKPLGELKKLKLSESLFEDVHNGMLTDDLNSDDVHDRLRSFESELTLLRNKYSYYATWENPWNNVRKQVKQPVKYRNKLKAGYNYKFEFNGPRIETRKVPEFSKDIENLVNKYDLTSYVKVDGVCTDWGRVVKVIITPPTNDSQSNDTIEESTAVAERPKSGVIYYKDAKHRDPLADVIQRELTDGEVVYKFSDKKGRFQATHAPSLNIDAMDVSVDYDEDRNDQPYILVRLADKALLDEVVAVGKKYGKEVKTGTERFMQGDKKLFAKIYLDDADFDGHYFDPNVPVKTGKGKKDEDDYE